MKKDFQSHRYVLRWHRGGLGSSRNAEMVGMDSYGPERLADMLMTAESLLARGYTLSISPPTNVPIIDATAAICDI